jgi:phospholipase/carboxylesterase
MRTERTTGGPLDYLSLVPEDFTPAAGFPLVVLLHGYGSNMDDLAHLAAVLHTTGYAHVVPNGPLEAFHATDDSMRAWYERGGDETPAGVALARARLAAFLPEVWQRFGTPPGRTVLLGFSQGGNLATRHGLPSPDDFAGVAVLAGSLKKLDQLTPELPTLRSQRVFIAHGYRDAVVPFQVGRDLVDFLQRHGYQPEFHGYTIQHTITTPLVDDLRRWLVRTLPPHESRHTGGNRA